MAIDEKMHEQIMDAFGDMRARLALPKSLTLVLFVVENDGDGAISDYMDASVSARREKKIRNWILKVLSK